MAINRMEKDMTKNNNLIYELKNGKSSNVVDYVYF